MPPEPTGPWAEKHSSSISVVIPSHNYARFIEECLRSVFAQTYPPDRLVVVDDGSKDGSPEIIARVLSDCPFPAELIARPWRGFTATLNEGFRNTGGEFFAYLNADDMWHPERLQVAIESLRENPDAVMSFGECLIVDGNGRLIADTRDRGYHLQDLNLHHLLQFRSLPLVATVTYRRNALEQLGGWNESTFMEDYETYLLLRSLGSFQYIPRALGYWRIHGSNMASNLPRNLYEVQETQKRVAARLGVAEQQLGRYQSSARFAYGEHFLRAGDWKTGARLTFGNLQGVPAASVLPSRLLRLLVPPPVVRARRALLNRRAKMPI
jgi:alpha-1,3-rhamnosyltransferase